VSLTKDQVQHIATLARLKLDDAEFDDVVDKLSRIVDFVDQLQVAATDHVLPMAHPLNMSQRFRTDEVTEENERDETHYIRVHLPNSRARCRMVSFLHVNLPSIFCNESNRIRNGSMLLSR
jgi:aspartyl-tRNA(Asn)/glutamyl-tRNA(Gln) amidotransferase subunit C